MRLSFSLSYVVASLFLCFTWALPVGTAQAESVHIEINDQLELTFAGPVRLSQVLETSLQHWQEQQGMALDVYWPNVRLAMVSGEQSQQQVLLQQKQDIVVQLQALQQAWQFSKPSQAKYLEHLAKQLQETEFAWQPYTTPDLGASRVDIAANPELQPGYYRLSLPSREAVFFIYGVTGSVAVQTLYSGKSLRQYLQAYTEIEEATSSHELDQQVYLIQQNKAPQRVGWQLHNANNTILLPGDIVFTGLSEAWLQEGVFAELAQVVQATGLKKQGFDIKELNQNIAQLLRHRWSSLGQDGQKLQGQEPQDALAQVQRTTELSSYWERQQTQRATSSDYGMTGLMQTMNARMAEEGDFSLGYYDMKEYRRYHANLQVLPWMQVGGFYVQIPSRLYSDSPGFSGDSMLVDKGFDMKVRLWQESTYIPEVSVGLLDLAGTGKFSSEFVAASKQLGAFDLTLGIGFGRMGLRDTIKNPFCSITNSFCDRTGGTSGKGGQLETGKWFRGPAAFFAGVEYQTPIDGLRLKAEYEGNDYSKETANYSSEPKSNINLGANYRPYDWLSLQLAYERGDTLTFGFSFHTNLNRITQIRLEPTSVKSPEQPAKQLADVSWHQVSHDVHNQYAYSMSRFAVEPDTKGYKLYAYVSPLRYRNDYIALDKASRVLAAHLPEDVHTYEFVHHSALQPQVSYQLDAETFKAQVNNQTVGVHPDDTRPLFTRIDPSSSHSVRRSLTQATKEAAQQAEQLNDEGEEDDFTWLYHPNYRFTPAFAMQPFFQQDLGAPETFQFYQFGLKAGATTWLTDNIWVVADVGANISNNYHKFNFKTDAFDHLPLERVRTHIREYADRNFWLDVLQINYLTQFNDSLHGLAYAGWLERMYAGVGGELLWRPLNSPLALGLQASRVRQRDFNGAFGLRDYETTTGFVTAYYQLPNFGDSLVQVGYGRFLAKDKGFALQFQRRFESGVIVGAFANLTNVSAKDYGEGSFTKGVFVNIPLDFLTVLPNRKRLNFGWVPLSRDGGQPLERRVELYGVTDQRTPFYGR